MNPQVECRFWGVGLKAKGLPESPGGLQLKRCNLNGGNPWIPGGFPETMGQHSRRSCCKSSKVLQTPVILHLLNRATLFGTCCLRAYL